MKPYFALLTCWRPSAMVRGLYISTLPLRTKQRVKRGPWETTPLSTGARSRRASTAARLANDQVEGRKQTLVAIGGGAAGYFGAIQAASSSRNTDGGSDIAALEVFVFEAGKLPLQKVKISGGGRCNVLHDSTKAVSLIAQGYPRGSKQLIGPFSSLFGPADTAAWFRERGVALKTEGDGRMFPQSDNSQTIIDCLQDAARKAGVHVISSTKVASFSRRTSDERGSAEDSAGVAYGAEAQPRFDLIVSTATPLSNTVLDLLGAAEVTHEATMETGETGNGNRKGKRIYAISCDYILQATGAARGGHVWAKQLGHAISPAVPSLFTLTVKDPRLESLAGLSVQDAELKLFPESNSAITAGKKRTASTDAESSQADQSLVAESGAVEARQDLSDAAAVTVSAKKKNAKRKKQGISQRGPLLITHSGFSGPAALKLSAFGARELKESGYRGKLIVNWLAGNNANKAIDELLAFRTKNAKKAVHSFCPLGGVGGTADSSGVPRRLWQRLALAAGVTAGEKWAEVAKAKLTALAQQLTVCEFEVVGKGSFKEEFVTCGGVSLSELDMRTMESRGVPGLYFAGEVVDIDGVTGGYNFQSAWTTGWVAGSAISARASDADVKRRVAIGPDN